MTLPILRMEDNESHTSEESYGSAVIIPDNGLSLALAALEQPGNRRERLPEDLPENEAPKGLYSMADGIIEGSTYLDGILTTIRLRAFEDKASFVANFKSRFTKGKKTDDMVRALCEISQ